jgi:hypothetical protein
VLIVDATHVVLILQRLAIAIFIIFGYYLYFKRWIFAASNKLADSYSFGGHFSRTDVTYVSELLCVAVTHMGLVALLAYLLGYNILLLFPTHLSLSSAITGVVLGIGEMGASSFLCRAAIDTAIGLNLGGQRRSLEWWLSGAKAGWLRHHLRTIKLLPLPVSLAIVGMQITAEESMFRGVMIELLSPMGLSVAACISCGLFVFMQFFHMPSWHSAIFPVIGAIVLGTVHTVLILAHCDIEPLIIAHLTFFAIVVI